MRGKKLGVGEWLIIEGGKVTMAIVTEIKLLAMPYPGASRAAEPESGVSVKDTSIENALAEMYTTGWKIRNFAISPDYNLFFLLEKETVQ